MPDDAHPLRVMLLGATGTIGRATAKALLDKGHDVTCFVRPDAANPRRGLPDGVTLRFGDVGNPTQLEQIGFAKDRFDALVSCLASRSGRPDEAWAIDYTANAAALRIGQRAGISRMVLLSAICVQRPLLAFQRAKLACEADLISSGLDHVIVRPTAFFKSLSGQVERVRRGKPFLLFGDGQLTACKPISDGDLGRYLADCLTSEDRRNRILPIGGPGPAITPLEQGMRLFQLVGQEPKFRHVPIRLMDTIIGGLSLLGRVSPRARNGAELARIGRYYATESMLVLDPDTGRYDPDATPSTGSETLFNFYTQLLSREAKIDLGAHAVFDPRNA